MQFRCNFRPKKYPLGIPSTQQTTKNKLHLKVCAYWHIATKTFTEPSDFLFLRKRCFVSCKYVAIQYNFQDDFRTIEYGLIGDDTAPLFFDINAQTGQITTSSPLERETTERYRVSYDVRMSEIPRNA